MGTNALNGFKYAKDFQTGDDNNGIGNAFSTPGPAVIPTIVGQTVVADPSYISPENGLSSYPDASHLLDYRNGVQADTFVNPGHAPKWDWYTGKYAVSNFYETPADGGHFA
ncbi:MAG TPA: hypothetical protein VGB94_04005, partial [Acidobacteriaceae bacterium]